MIDSINQYGISWLAAPLVTEKNLMQRLSLTRPLFLGATSVLATYRKAFYTSASDDSDYNHSLRLAPDKDGLRRHSWY